MTNIIDKIQVSGVTYDIGGSITIDPTLDTGSTNPVANSAITTALDNKANSSDTITSVGLDWYDAIQQIYLKYIKGGSNWSTPFIANGSGTTLTKSGGIVHVNVDTTTIQPKLSAGTNITISGNVISATGGGGGNPTVELTQAEYDALVTAGTVSADTYYIITDAQAGDLTQYWTSAQTNSAITQATSGKVDVTTFETALSGKADTSYVDQSVSGKQDTLVSGTNIKTINNESLLGSGNIDIQGGSTYTAGRGIDITNDTISFSLPISANTNNSVVMGGKSSSSFTNNGTDCLMVGSYLTTNNGSDCSLVVGYGSSVNGDGSAVIGWHSKSVGDSAFAFGTQVSANTSYTFATGYRTVTNNQYEHTSGLYNVSNTGSTYADKTIFSVGNGTSTSARHNAFEIRQNGDIYLSSGGTDIKLQDHLGGGGGIDSGTVQTMIDESISGKADTSAVTAIQDSLSGYVTTNTDQDISGIKTFVGEKKIKFKQSSDSDKLGFTLYSSASTNNELGAFELRPNTYTDSSSVSHPLLYIGHYRNNATANAGVVQAMVGFRQYDQSGAAAYHYLMPLPAEAKTPFNLTTSFKNYFAPLGFKNGSTMITADNTGVVDLSSELGGLKLVKLSQSEYDALSPNYDSNTLYVIVN